MVAQECARARYTYFKEVTMKRIGVFCLLNIAVLSSSYAVQPNQSKTASANFTVAWVVKAQRIPKENGVVVKIPEAHYQISMPFTDYANAGEQLIPYAHFLLNEHYQYDLHVDSVPSSLLDKAGNDLVKWYGLSSDFHIDVLPTTEPSPISSTIESESRLETIYRISKPIVMNKNQRPFARIDAMKLKVTKKENVGLTDIVLDGSFDTLTMFDTKKTYGPGKLIITINKLDTESAKAIDTMEVDLKSMDAEKHTQALQNVMMQIPALFGKGAQYKFDLHLKTPTGDISCQYETDLATLLVHSLNMKKLIPTLLTSNNKQQLPMLIPFLDDLVGHVNLDISKEDLHDWMKVYASDRLEYKSIKHTEKFITSEHDIDVNDILLAGEQRGMLSTKGQQYIFNFDFARGQQSNKDSLFFLSTSHTQ